MFKKLLALSLLVAIAFVHSGKADFASECLQAHNDYRARHRAPPLRLDGNLQRIAQNYADYLVNSDKFQHSGNGYGENLYGIWGNSDISGYIPVKAWYDEVKYYNYNNPGFSSATGHFTQVVWKNSAALGCAVGKRGSTAIVVANYSPPGNYGGQFQANVLPPW